jgi:haloalkane dehalogenase
VAETFRTPEERFAGLPAFPSQPRYREVDGLRLCHLDEGEGEPVVTELAASLLSDLDLRA